MWRRIAASLSLALFLVSAAAADEPSSVTEQLQAMQVEALQQEILSNPRLFEQVLALQESTAFRSVMEDPVLLARIRSGDLDILLNDPKLAALAEDPLVKALAADLAR